jgi:hypothetical protein
MVEAVIAVTPSETIKYAVVSNRYSPLSYPYPLPN